MFFRLVCGTLSILSLSVFILRFLKFTIMYLRKSEFISKIINIIKTEFILKSIMSPIVLHNRTSSKIRRVTSPFGYSSTSSFTDFILNLIQCMSTPYTNFLSDILYNTLSYTVYLEPQCLKVVEKYFIITSFLGVDVIRLFK